MQIRWGLVFLAVILRTVPVWGQCTVVPYSSGTSASFRGLSVLNDSVAWVGGSNGTILSTETAGVNWTQHSIVDCPKCDFRTVYALNNTHAIVANAGYPATVYLTKDKGRTWEKVHEWTDSTAFIDGVAFFNKKHGILYGDPHNGRLRLLRTRDGGASWRELPSLLCPELVEGEASFAASGTTIQTVGRRTVLIATGGTQSRLLVSANKGRTWRSITTPILQGSPSRGIFSIWASDKRNWIIAGGDYLRDSVTLNNCFYTNDGGKHWLAPQSQPRGYRECVVQTKTGTLLAIGPSGIDISTDAGKHWQPCSEHTKLHVARKARHGQWVVAAGGSRQIVALER